mmetsp:Transcript_25398/g.70701  ORF Transcript_25398/g.70701 Transcript_25398/m.70701 type:complete len:250 (+) Transcript_25398:40-789(+)
MARCFAMEVDGTQFGGPSRRSLREVLRTAVACKGGGGRHREEEEHEERDAEKQNAEGAKQRGALLSARILHPVDQDWVGLHNKVVDDRCLLDRLQKLGIGRLQDASRRYANATLAPAVARVATFEVASGRIAAVDADGPETDCPRLVNTAVDNRGGAEGLAVPVTHSSGSVGFRRVREHDSARVGVSCCRRAGEHVPILAAKGTGDERPNVRLVCVKTREAPGRHSDAAGRGRQSAATRYNAACNRRPR